MKKLIALMTVLAAVPAFAQTPAPTAPTGVTTTGSVLSGVSLVGNDTNSSKLTEYRDLRDDFFVPKVVFGVFDAGNQWYFDLAGTNASRRDQSIAAATGVPGVFTFAAQWHETPHHFSNKALTPYIDRGNGLLTVPATVPITFKKLATAAADTPGVVASDDLVAAFQAEFLKPVDLGTQTRHGRFAMQWTGAEALGFSVAYDRREKTGTKSGFGPIGDRPPRTLNIQLAEPVDYLTHDVTLAAEHDGGAYQLRGEYLFSQFANAIDTLRWENVYTTAAPGADFDVWDRLVATVGARPLPPDNTQHLATVSGGVNLPRDSRLSASVALGQYDQDTALLPYASHSGVNRPLPRQTAQGDISTKAFNADYVVNPWAGVNLRAFLRRYDLNNDTPASQWQYVTQDTSNLNGTSSFVNKRISVAHAWDRTQAGADATMRLPGRSRLTLGYQRENKNYAHREADTTENVLRAGLRVRPTPTVSMQLRYLLGLRAGTEYNNEVTHEGYWYTAADNPDNNNPAVTFDNHPDMRRFDVIDRQRQQVDFTVNLAPGETFAVSAFVRYRKDDFDADVQPSQPLLGTGLAEQNATTPGDQLGFLEDTRLRYGVDLFVQPNPRVSFNAFLNYDKGTMLERSLEFNENNKQNPSAIATAELGPWTRAGSQWTADFDDTTWSGGLGTTLQLVPERVTMVADYTMSLASVDITYAGFGVTNWDGTPFAPNHQFAFSSPPASTQDLHVFNMRFEIPIRMLTAVVGYSYESYRLTDWQEGGIGHWVEAVGADTLLRDTSRSFQWGNRLFNLGTYLAPSYDAHIGFLGLAYRF